MIPWNTLIQLVVKYMKIKAEYHYLPQPTEYSGLLFINEAFALFVHIKVFILLSTESPSTKPYHPNFKEYRRPKHERKGTLGFGFLSQ